MVRTRRTLNALAIAALVLAAFSSVPAQAYSLDGQSVTVSLLETGYDPAVETVTAGSTGRRDG